jgi:hypothetical protein
MQHVVRVARASLLVITKYSATPSGWPPCVPPNPSRCCTRVFRAELSRKQIYQPTPVLLAHKLLETSISLWRCCRWRQAHFRFSCQHRALSHLCQRLKWDTYHHFTNSVDIGTFFEKFSDGNVESNSSCFKICCSIVFRVWQTFFKQISRATGNFLMQMHGLVVSTKHENSEGQARARCERARCKREILTSSRILYHEKC